MKGMMRQPMKNGIRHLANSIPPRTAIVSPVTASFKANPMVAATKIATCWLADWNEV